MNLQKIYLFLMIALIAVEVILIIILSVLLSQLNTDRYTPKATQDINTQGPIKTKYYEGDKNATTTWFHLAGGDDNGEGSCGGCNLEDLYDKMKKLDTPYRWTVAATSEAMMNTKGGKSSCSTNTSDTNSGTANAPCGTCWQLTRKDNGHKINVVVADLCPTEEVNSEWCNTKAGKKNSHGSKNHFDVWNGDRKDLWPGEQNPQVTFMNIECPQEIKTLMKKSCCDVWGKKQGCPNICGPGYTFHQ